MPDLDEFSLIQHFFFESSSDVKSSGVILGIGDDTAILETVQGEELLFTTDTLISGVHFPHDTHPAAIGHKALAVNLSDIAAMGGEARWFTLALSCPEADTAWLQAFSDGLMALSKQHLVSLVGGDTTRGPLSITISVIGTIPAGGAVRRSGARPGDVVFVTGQPGMAALGLATLKGTIKPTAITQSLFQRKLDYPQPRLSEGHLLRSYATSMIDISDGLSADLDHILKSSNCSAVIDAAALIDWQSVAGQQTAVLSEKTILDAALYGGDDYELLFTIPESRLALLEQAWPQSFASLKRIGVIAEGEGLMLKDKDGNDMKISARGYNHFHE